MLCSKCYESITREKEMQVEGSIICKECALVVKKENEEKVIARCWNCNCFIHRNELIHESNRNDSKTFSKWFSIGIGSSEKLFQCDECYQKWRSDVEKSEDWSRWKFIFFGFCTGIFLGAAIELFFPEIHKRMHNNPSSTLILMISFFAIFITFGPILEINRHKIRKNKRKKEKAKK